MNRYNLEDIAPLKTGLSTEVIEALAELGGVALFNLHLPTGDIGLNRVTTRLTGYEPGDLPHSENSKMMLTFEDDRPRVERCVGELLSGEKPSYGLEYRMRRRDGSIVSVEEHAVIAERDGEGNPVRMAGLALDLSRIRWAEEKARAMEKEARRLTQGLSESGLAEQNRMLRAANAAAAMVIGGFHQDYETVLRQAMRILGECVGADRAYIWRNMEQDGRLCCFPRTQWADDVGFNVPEGTVIAYDDLIPGWRNIFNEEYYYLRSVRELPGSVRKLPWLRDVKSILLTPLFLHGEFWGMLGFDDCACERAFTRDEAEIMESGALVIASSISRNETFAKLNETREEALASTRAKGEFLSRMSHEIRTPMNAIIGMANIAKKAEDPDKIRYCLDKIDVSSRQLLNLINDVLDMSKIDSGKFEIHPSPFDFEAMMQNIFSVVQVRMEEKRHRFRVDFSHVITRLMIADELRLTQVLLNLLTNAIKFTPECGEILLRVDFEDRGGGRARLKVSVRDSGIGIDPEQQQRLFSPFEQADGSITRRFGGTGLGLAICKKIVELMNGDIWVESVPGKGATFLFEADVAWGDPLPATSKKIPDKLRVLVVDDAEDVREYFMSILRTFSAACDAAPDGESAVEMVKGSLRDGRPYDMVFVDWKLPGINGGQAASEIRTLMKGDVVVCMISVSDWTDIAQEAGAYGITNFLPKPVLPSALYNMIVHLTDNTLVTEKTPGAVDIPDWSGRTILIAEDIEINREIIQGILGETGAALVMASDGAQAVESFAANPAGFDLILMDVQMPVLDGLEATRRIRALGHAAAQTVPILAMTANAFKEDAALCMEAGMNEHIAKPLDVDRLLTKLGHYFNAYSNGKP